MRVSILEPWGVIYEGNADEAVLPSEEGEVCILDFHQPFLCSLTAGYVQIKGAGLRPQASGEKQDISRFLIKQGVARMSGSELFVLVET
jgi:F0F1-type ATP synthase epsilon subunit